MTAVALVLATVGAFLLWSAWTGRDPRDELRAVFEG